MPSEDIEVRLFSSGEQELRALAARMRRSGQGELQLRLRRNLRAAGQPVLSELRAAVRSVEVASSRGGTAYPDYSRKLRERVAKALRLSVAYRGIRFNVQSQAIGEGKYGATLPKYLDASLPGYRQWRHPVFGNSEVWAEQTGKPWFFVTIMANADRFETACEQAINEIIGEIA